MNKLLRTMLRMPDLERATGLSAPNLYVKISQGLFTKPVRIGNRAVAFPSDEVDAIIGARIAGQTDDEIRALVDRLHELRKHAASASAVAV